MSRRDINTRQSCMCVHTFVSVLHSVDHSLFSTSLFQTPRDRNCFKSKSTKQTDDSFFGAFRGLTINMCNTGSTRTTAPRAEQWKVMWCTSMNTASSLVLDCLPGHGKPLLIEPINLISVGNSCYWENNDAPQNYLGIDSLKSVFKFTVSSRGRCRCLLKSLFIMACIYLRNKKAFII